MMHWWCTEDALMMHSLCAHDALMNHQWWCADNALMMCCWCPDDALMMPWWCPDEAWWCTDDAPMVHSWCSNDALMVHWWCTEYYAHRSGFGPSLKVSWTLELMMTKHEDDWRQRRRQQQGEYRAICLWKMEMQSFAIRKRLRGAKFTRLTHLLSFLSLLAPTGALVVMMCYYISSRWHPLFEIFTQSIDAIHSKLLKQYQCNWCHKRMLNGECPLVNWSIGPLHNVLFVQSYTPVVKNAL